MGRKACTTPIRLPGDEVLVECLQHLCVLDIFVQSVCGQTASDIWSEERTNVLGVCFSLPPWFCLGAKPLGQTCDTDRHRTRHCTQTSETWARMHLFQYCPCWFAVMFSSLSRLASIGCSVNLWSESGRCEAGQTRYDSATCGASL